MTGSVVIFLTEKCNEKCHYCDIPQLNKPKHIDLDIFDKYIDQIVDLSIKHNKMMRLSGGEPGLLNEKTLSHIFSKLPVKVEVNTNGLWFKKGYDKLFKDQIDSYNYHILDINNYIDYKSDTIINKRFVIDNDNFENVIDINDDIKWNPYESKNGNTSKILSDKQYNKINHSDITNKLNKFKKFKCLTATRSFDFVNGTIKDCCMSYTLSPSCKMTKENINLKFKNTSSEKYLLCDKCIRKLKSIDNITDTLMNSIKQNKKILF